MGNIYEKFRRGLKYYFVEKRPVSGCQPQTANEISNVRRRMRAVSKHNNHNQFVFIISSYIDRHVVLFSHLVKQTRLF